MTFAVGGLDGSIHVYAWSLHEKPYEKAVVYYRTSLKIPQTVTFCFIHGSRYLVVGGDAEVATVFDLVDSREVAELIHQSKFHMCSSSGFLFCCFRGVFYPSCSRTPNYRTSDPLTYVSLRDGPTLKSFA
jgi:hypothetical protein